MLVVFAAIVGEVLASRFGTPFVLIGVLIGLVIGIIVSRSYRLSWDVEANKVISHSTG